MQLENIDVNKKDDNKDNKGSDNVIELSDNNNIPPSNTNLETLLEADLDPTVTVKLPRKQSRTKEIYAALVGTMITGVVLSVLGSFYRQFNKDVADNLDTVGTIGIVSSAAGGIVKGASDIIDCCLKKKPEEGTVITFSGYAAREMQRRQNASETSQSK